MIAESPTAADELGLRQLVAEVWLHRGLLVGVGIVWWSAQLAAADAGKAARGRFPPSPAMRRFTTRDGSWEHSRNHAVLPCRDGSPSRR